MSVIDRYPGGGITVRLQGAEDWEEVFQADVGGSYEWDEIQAFYSPSSRKFYWISGSGCSCDSLYESVNTVSDFSSGERQDCVNAVRSFLDEEYRYEENKSIARKLDGVAKVMTFEVTNA